MKTTVLRILKEALKGKLVKVSPMKSYRKVKGVRIVSGRLMELEFYDEPKLYSSNTIYCTDNGNIYIQETV